MQSSKAEVQALQFKCSQATRQLPWRRGELRHAKSTPVIASDTVSSTVLSTKGIDVTWPLENLDFVAIRSLIAATILTIDSYPRSPKANMHSTPFIQYPFRLSPLASPLSCLISGGEFEEQGQYDRPSCATSERTADQFLIDHRPCSSHH